MVHLFETLINTERAAWLNNYERVSSLSGFTRLLHDQYNGFIDTLETVQEATPNPAYEKKLNIFKAELAALVKIVPARVEFLDDRARVIMTTPEITLTIPGSNRPVPLGRFELRLPIDLSSLYADTMVVEALTPLYPLYQTLLGGGDRGLTPHPHVNRHNICLGGGEAAFRKAARDLRLADLYEIALAVLQNYNPASPFAKLEDWFRTRCRLCGNMIDQETLVKCSYCDTVMCPKCATDKTCHVCGKTTCGSHRGGRAVQHCSLCKHNFCVKHFEKHECVTQIQQIHEQMYNWLEGFVQENHFNTAPVPEVVEIAEVLHTTDEMLIVPPTPTELYNIAGETIGTFTPFVFTTRGETIQPGTARFTVEDLRTPAAQRRTVDTDEVRVIRTFEAEAEEEEVIGPTGWI